MSRYAKAIAAALGSGLTVAVTMFPHSTWLPIASAAATVLATYAVPNVPKDKKAST